MSNFSKKREPTAVDDVAFQQTHNQWAFVALDESPDAVIVTDKDGLVVYVNQAFTLLSGYLFKEVVGKTPAILKSGIHDISFYADLWNTILSGERWVGAVCNKRKNGLLYWVQNTIVPFKNGVGEITNFISIQRDIDDKKVSGTTRDETLLLQKKFLESLPFGALVDLDGRIVWASGKVMEITNIPVDAILNHPIEDLFLVKKRGESLNSMALRKISANRFFQTEQELRTSDSSNGWCSLDAFAVTSVANKVEVVWLLKKISKEKPIDRSVKKSVELFRNAFNSNASAMYVASYADGEILEVNTAFENLTGFNRELSLGHTTKDLGIWINSERKKMFEKLSFSNSILDYETHFYTKSRAKRSCMVNVALVGNSTGKLIYVSFVDTTVRKKAVKELKESEEMFRFMAEGINDVISLHKPNMEATITYISPAIQSIAGYHPNDLVNKSLEDIVAREDWIDILVNANLRLYSGSTKLELVEYRIVDTNGVIHWVESTLKPVLDEKRTVTMVIAVSRDVTHRRVVEQQLRELNSMKDKFLSIIAHDLKNPFNALLGFSSLLLGSLSSLDHDKITEYVTEIHNAAGGGVKLLEELLQWAMIQSGAMTCSAEVLKLSDISKEVFELASIQAATNHIYLVDNIPGKMEVVADRRMVATILRNLVTNAIKFTKPGGVVRVGAEKMDKFVAVTVADSGIGLQPKDLGKLFRIDVKPTEIGSESDGKGTGLGLILCSEFVKKQGGTISAKSVFGQGAEFTFTLPAV